MDGNNASWMILVLDVVKYEQTDAEEGQTVISTIKNNASALEVITDLALYIDEQGLTEAVGKISEVKEIFQKLIIKSKCCSEAKQSTLYDYIKIN